MQEREPSRTALAAAFHRAAHQIIEKDHLLFTDPLALPIIGTPAAEVVAAAKGRPPSGAMRFFIAARTGFSEACLKAGVEGRGVAQLVVLGAGLDTFGYRNPYGETLRVFEVDHPATQAWKRRRLAEAQIAIPPSLAYAPVDFERESLSDGLAAAGFDPGKRTFFTWLGVVPYLTNGAVDAGLAFIGALPGGGEVVFDYGDPTYTLSPEARANQEARAAFVAAQGEPFLTYFEAEPLEKKLRGFGFTAVDDLSPLAIIGRFMGPQAHAAVKARGGPDRGGHMVHAATA